MEKNIHCYFFIYSVTHSPCVFCEGFPNKTDSFTLSHSFPNRYGNSCMDTKMKAGFAGKYTQP